MKEGTRFTLIGLFVMLAMSALGALLVMIGETPAWLGGAEWEMRIIGVRQLSPIAEGTEVNLNGVNIGRVARLDFVDPSQPGRGVVIITRIKKKYGVPQHSFAKVYSPALGVGRGRIDIVPPDMPNPKPLSEDSAVINGRMASMLREVISEDMITSFHRTVDQIGDFAEALTPVAREMERLIQQRTITEVDQPPGAVPALTANLSTVVERLDVVLRNVNAVVGDRQSQEDIKAVAANLGEASRSLVELVEQLRRQSTELARNVNDKLDRTDRRLDDLFARAQPILDHLESLTGHLERAAADAAQGRGTVGLMLRDDRLYESLVESAQRVSLLIATLQPLAETIAARERIPIEAKTAIGPVKRDIPLHSE